MQLCTLAHNCMNIAICRQFAWQMKVADTGMALLHRSSDSR
ncbi:hypothetical protein [Wolbachia endosymbiont of Muscidifurax uniraptor]